MDASKSVKSGTQNEEKIVIPTCVHAVRPLDFGVEKTPTQLEKVISTYDHIIDTAVTQLALLESMDTAAIAQKSEAPKSAPKRPAPSQTKPSKAVSAHPSRIATRFEYKWPTDLKYPLSIAVKVNAKHIPVTPWLFRRIFGSAVHVRLHKHSSYEGPLPSLVNDNAREYKLDEVKLIFTVVVHDIERVEFVVDPLRQGILRDEHQLQRYLLRLLKIFAPMDPVQDASSESYIDMVGRSLLRGAQPAATKSTLASLDGEVRTKKLLVRPDQLTPADFSLLAASYVHDLRSFCGIESFRKHCENYFEVKNDNTHWFKAES